MNAPAELPPVPLPDGIRSRMVPGINGLTVHVLEAGRRLVLCGVEVPHDRGVAGHSDADVGIHALCDAIYGALAEGDIEDRIVGIIRGAGENPLRNAPLGGEMDDRGLPRGVERLRPALRGDRGGEYTTLEACQLWVGQHMDTDG